MAICSARGERAQLPRSLRSAPTAVAVGFEPTVAINHTRFRGVLLWPLGHATAEKITAAASGPGHRRAVAGAGGRGVSGRDAASGRGPAPTGSTADRPARPRRRVTWPWPGAARRT